jgi:hypothetical protein
MIKSNELRIGNYIDYERTTHVVTRLLEHYVSHDWHKSIGEDAYDTSYDSINPIPLTSEILEKCGFKLRDGYLKNYPLYSITSQNGKEQIQITGYMSLPQIKYLHQLQNLYFALTGKELIINL